MKFNRLKASVTNNSDQQPSIYMALCMVESLFADLEDEYGKNFSQCPAGDERLTNKLLWLIRSINGVYEDKSDDLQRNRARLDKEMTKLQGLEGELAQHAKTAEQLSAAQKERAELEARLRQATEKKRRYDELVKESAQLRTEIEDLNKVDLTQVEQEIKTMKDKREEAAAQAKKLRTAAEEFRSRELAPLEATVDKLRTEIAGLQNRKDQEEEKVSRCQAERDKQQADLAALDKERKQLQAEQSALERETGNLEQTIRKLEKDLSDVKAAQDDAVRRAAELRSSIDSVRQTGLNPAEENVKALQQELTDLERECGRMNREYQSGMERKNTLTQNIARLKDEAEAAAKALKETQERWQRQESDKKKLDDQLAELFKELDHLQASVENLERREIPEAKALLNKENQRKQSLARDLETLRTEKTRLLEEIEKLSGLLPQQQDLVKNKQAVYDSLTAAHTASSKQLETLEAQIEELRNKTDQEKLEIYRKQLEATRQQLQDIQDECRKLEEENAGLLRETEERETERLHLEKLRKTHEAGLQAMDKMLRELDLVATEKYARDAGKTAQRLEQMEKVRKKLSASVSMMQEVLGYSPVADAFLDDQLKTGISELKKRTDQFCEALCDCAKSLKMEEQ